MTNSQPNKIIKFAVIYSAQCQTDLSHTASEHFDKCSLVTGAHIHSTNNYQLPGKHAGMQLYTGAEP